MKSSFCNSAFNDGEFRLGLSRMVSFIRVIFVTLFSVLVSSCMDSSPDSKERVVPKTFVEKGRPIGMNVSPVGQVPVDYKEAYSDLKGYSNKSDDQVNALFQQFSDRTAMADVITLSSIAKDPELQLKILEARNNVLIQYHFKHVMEVEVTEAEIKHYYDTNAHEFTEWHFNLEYLLISTIDNLDKIGDHQKLLLDSIEDQLDEGNNFSGIAKSSFGSGYSLQTGEMILNGTEEYLRELIESAQTLNEGEISSPIKTSKGIYFIRQIEKPKSYRKKFDLAKEGIAYKLRDQARRKETKRLMSVIN